MACCCGLRLPNIIITKANAKENPGGIYLPFHFESERRNKISRFFICNHFRADGKRGPVPVTGPSVPLAGPSVPLTGRPFPLWGPFLIV